jgi:hypothetical protein
VWSPPAAPQTTNDLPRMVYLPAALARIPVEKERTAFEMHKYLDELITKDNSEIEENEAKFLLKWFMAAGQMKHGTTSQQKIALK